MNRFVLIAIATSLSLGFGLAAYYRWSPLPDIDAPAETRAAATSERADGRPSRPGETGETRVEKRPAGASPDAADSQPPRRRAKGPRGRAKDSKDRPPRTRRVDDDVLRAADLSSGEIEWIREKAENVDAERSRLWNLAREDKGRLTGEELESFWQPELELQQAIGSENYDRMLRAASEPNRVEAAWVGPRSPAGRAGLMQGDIIVRYDGQDVFKVPVFQMLERQIEPGQEVSLTYLRNGELVTTSYTVQSRLDKPVSLMDGLRVRGIEDEE